MYYLKHAVKISLLLVVAFNLFIADNAIINYGFYLSGSIMAFCAIVCFSALFFIDTGEK